MSNLPRFRGANELGLKVEWRFRFIPPGSRASSLPGVLCVDVGGTLAPGVLDHHQGSDARCAAECVLNNRELVYGHLFGEWLRRSEERSIAPGTIWQPTIVTHENPDWDAAIAVYLSMTLIETGDFPEEARALVEYAAEVDQGRMRLNPEKIEDLKAPHLAHLAIQNLPGHDSEKRLRRAFELIRLTTELASKEKAREQVRAADLQPPSAAAGAWWSDDRFSDARTLLLGDREDFERDMKERAAMVTVSLPTLDDSEALSVKGIVMSEPPRSVLDKYWFRGLGYRFLIVPRNEARWIATEHGTQEKSYPQVIISVDPTADVPQPLSLKGLGYALEREETRLRHVINGGVDTRGGKPRFADGYCDNQDPWYDGRGHHFGIVDSPSEGTVLPYDRIVRVATSGQFWQVPLRTASMTVIRCLASGVGEELPKKTAGLAALAPSLLAYARDTVETEVKVEEPIGLFKVTSWVRRPPPGTGPAFQIVEICAAGNATLEEMLEARRQLLTAMNTPGSPLSEVSHSLAGTSNDYSFARVSFSPNFIPQGRIRLLLSEFGDGELLSLSNGADEAGDLVLFGGRALVVHEIRPKATNGADADRELFLYIAFVCETLSQFEAGISKVVGDDRTIDSEKSATLREDFLRFQTRYYSLEIATSFRRRRLANELLKSLNVKERYVAVRQELEGLSQIESQIAARAQGQADAIMQFILYLINVSIVLQTVVAFRSWPGWTPDAWSWIGSTVATGLLIYLLILRVSRRVRRLGIRERFDGIPASKAR
jgi:hypothetical protein